MNQWDNRAVSVYHRIEPPSWDSVTYSQLMDSWDSLSLNSDIASKTEGSRFKHVEPDSNNQGGYHGIMVKPGLSWLNLDYHGLTWLITWLNMVFHSVD